MAEAWPLPEPEAIVKRINRSLECSICMERYTDPRVLNCLHSFCLQCITDHVGAKQVIICPLCNDSSPKPDNGVQALKANFFLNTLIDDVICSTKAADESDVKLCCGSCEKEVDELAAHCDGCQSDICSDCVELHDQLKIFKQHKISMLPTKAERVHAMCLDFKGELKKNISSLTSKITKLEATISPCLSHKQKIISQIDLNYKSLLSKLDEYVQKLKDEVNRKTDQSLGQLPDQKQFYEKKLSAFKILQKQEETLSEIQIDVDGREKLCQQLQSELQELTRQSKIHGKFVSHVGEKLQLSDTADYIDLDNVFRECIGCVPK